MRVVASLALYPGLTMDGGTPFVSSGLMARAAQIGVGCDGHGRFRVVRLEGAMTGFASYASFGVFSRLFIVARGMAFQAGNLVTELRPITLEDGGSEGLCMACALPFGVDILVTLCARLGAGVALYLIFGR